VKATQSTSPRRGGGGPPGRGPRPGRCGRRPPRRAPSPWRGGSTPARGWPGRPGPAAPGRRHARGRVGTPARGRRWWRPRGRGRGDAPGAAGRPRWPGRRRPPGRAAAGHAGPWREGLDPVAEGGHAVDAGEDHPVEAAGGQVLDRPVELGGGGDGRISMVGTSSGSAPRARSRAEKSPAWSRARGRARSARPAAAAPGSTAAVLDQGADLGPQASSRRSARARPRPSGSSAGPRSRSRTRPLPSRAERNPGSPGPGVGHAQDAPRPAGCRTRRGAAGTTARPAGRPGTGGR
jgi:hypothetical protein